MVVTRVKHYFWETLNCRRIILPSISITIETRSIPRIRYGILCFVSYFVSLKKCSHDRDEKTYLYYMVSAFSRNNLTLYWKRRYFAKKLNVYKTDVLELRAHFDMIVKTFISRRSCHGDPISYILFSPNSVLFLYV